MIITNDWSVCANKASLVFDSIRENVYKIEASGYFHPFVKPEEKLPSEIGDISRRVEDILRASFPEVQIAGLESPPERNPDQPETRYASTVYGTKSSDIILMFCMEITHSTRVNVRAETETLKDAPFKFNFFLPQREYIEQTAQTVTKMWPLIRGFEYAEHGLSQQFNPRLFQPGSIRLQQVVYVATGLAAFRQARIIVPPKSIHLKDGYDMTN
ncbi:MAG: hypothetical protein ABIE94_01170 [archaeon]